MQKCLPYLLFLSFGFVLASCGKGYKVRVANYYTEDLDSVIVGNYKVVFADIARNQTSDFKNLSKGKYQVVFRAKNNKSFRSEVFIPSSGTGQRTLQIDGSTQIVILEE